MSAATNGRRPCIGPAFQSLHWLNLEWFYQFHHSFHRFGAVNRFNAVNRSDQFSAKVVLPIDSTKFFFYFFNLIWFYFCLSFLFLFVCFSLLAVLSLLQAPTVPYPSRLSDVSLKTIKPRFRRTNWRFLLEDCIRRISNAASSTAQESWTVFFFEVFEAPRSSRVKLTVNPGQRYKKESPKYRCWFFLINVDCNWLLLLLLPVLLLLLFLFYCANVTIFFFLFLLSFYLPQNRRQSASSARHPGEHPADETSQRPNATAPGHHQFYY